MRGTRFLGALARLFLATSIFFASTNCGQKNPVDAIVSVVISIVSISSGTVNMQLSATFSSGSVLTVTNQALWAVSNPNVLVVASEGVISAVGAGSNVLVSALYAGFLATATVTTAMSGSQIIVQSATSNGPSTIPSGQSVASGGSGSTAGGTTTGGTTTGGSSTGGTTTGGSSTAGTTTGGSSTGGTTTGGSSTGGTTTGGTTTGGTTGGGCSGGGVSHAGGCWYITSTNQSCNARCAALGLAFDSLTDTYGRASLANCGAVVSALGRSESQGSNLMGDYCCFLLAGTYNLGASCTGAGQQASSEIICACQ